jgi:hypothetical protein
MKYDFIDEHKQETNSIGNDILEPKQEIEANKMDKEGKCLALNNLDKVDIEISPENNKDIDSSDEEVKAVVEVLSKQENKDESSSCL